jgi:hypothetical protein
MDYNTYKWLNRLADHVVNNLSSDLLKKPHTNHCYVASEAFWHMTGKQFKPMFIRHEKSPHWFLMAGDGFVIDLTRSQFQTHPNYDSAKGKGFLTKQPSKRAQHLIDRIHKQQKEAR